MSRVDKYNSQNEQLVGYFSSYIARLYCVVGEVKTMVYSLVNIHGITNKKYQIPEDIHSIKSTCNRTLEDMKRIETILKGHIKGRDGQLDDNRPSVSKKSKINLNNFQQNESQKQTPRSNKIYKEDNDKNYSSIKLSELKQSPVIQIQKYKSIPKQNNKVDDNQLSIQNFNDLQKTVDQTTTTTIPNDQNIFRKDYEIISRIRQRRQKETQSMNNNTRQCLNLIKSIKKQLQLNKNKSKKKL